MRISIATLLICTAAVQISIATHLICTAAVQISIATLLVCRAAVQISFATLLICRAAVRIATAIFYCHVGLVLPHAAPHHTDITTTPQRHTKHLYQPTDIPGLFREQLPLTVNHRFLGVPQTFFMCTVPEQLQSHFVMCTTPDCYGLFIMTLAAV